MKTLFKVVFLVLLLPFLALAQDEISLSTGIISNGRLLGAKSYDGQLTVGVLGLDSSNNTVLDSLSGKGIACRVDGTTEVTIKDDEIEFSATGKVDAVTSLALAIGDTAEATLTNDQLALSGSNFQLVPGDSTFTIRNNADDTNNYLFEDGGTFKIQGASAGLEITGQAGTTIKLKSPDGTCSSCSVDNADAFSCTSVAC